MSWSSSHKSSSHWAAPRASARARGTCTTKAPASPSSRSAACLIPFLSPPLLPSPYLPGRTRVLKVSSYSSAKSKHNTTCHASSTETHEPLTCSFPRNHRGLRISHRRQTTDSEPSESPGAPRVRRHCRGLRRTPLQGRDAWGHLRAQHPVEELRRTEPFGGFWRCYADEGSGSSR